MGSKRSLSRPSQHASAAEAGSARRRRRTASTPFQRQWPSGSIASSYSASHDRNSTPAGSSGCLEPLRSVSDLDLSPMEASRDSEQVMHDEQYRAITNENIMAVDMKDSFTLGCAFFSTIDGSLSLAQDIALADTDALEQLMVYVQPTTMIISSRTSERLISFIDKNERFLSSDRQEPQTTICTADASEFTLLPARERLLDLYSEMNMENQATFLSHDPANTTVACNMSEQPESRDIKLLRLGTVIDIESVLSVICAGVVISELQRRRSADGRLSDEGPNTTYRIQALTTFNISDYMFISSESLSALQIVKHEMHPNTQLCSQDSSGNATRESLSVYGLFHHIVCTSQGRTCLQRLFLRPTVDIEVIQQRHSAMSVFLREENRDILRQTTQCLRKIPNARKFILQLQKGTNNGSASNSFEKGVWARCESFSSNVTRLSELVVSLSGVDSSLFLQNFMRKLDHPSIYFVRNIIQKVIDFEQSKLRQRPSIRIGIDTQLDEIKRHYDGMESFLTEVVNHITNESPSWAGRYIQSCIFLPQLGFLTVIELDRETGNGKYSGEGNSSDVWEKIFVSEGAACYKNEKMRHLDNTYGDMYCEIGDREIEIMHQLGAKVLEFDTALIIASDLCGELDAIIALAIGAQRYNWIAPYVTESRVIDIREARHPLQELVVPCFVTNDCQMSTSIPGVTATNEVLVLTGPNHSGKSVYLKQVAIIVYLAHIGSFVPAESAVIGITDKILTRLSTNETASGGESAFAIDLRQTLQAVRQSTSRSLILIDEFGKGTCCTNGAGLMAALLDHLVSLDCDSRPMSLIATHFHEIFDGSYVLESNSLRFIHMKVQLDLQATGPGEQVTYLFKVTRGRSTASFGAECAAMNGMPGSVVDRAKAISLLINRNECLAAFCARLSDEEELRLEAAEAIARRFMEHNMRQWSTSSAKKMLDNLIPVTQASSPTP